MVGHLGSAVVGHVADEDIARRRGRPRDPVVPHPHAYDRTQSGKSLDVLGCDRIAHDHQPVDFGAVGGIEVGEGLGVSPHEADFGTEDLRFQAVVRDLPFLGVEHRYRHCETFTGWWSVAERTIASKAATPCSTSSGVIG